MGKEFWTIILDIVLFLVSYFGKKYLNESIFEDVQAVVLVLQPLFVYLIARFAIQRQVVQSFLRK